MQTIRRVAVIGGNRIPFARSNSRYASASNQDMLTAALDGLVARFGLSGERLGEVVAGAVLKHSRDFNLTREVVLGSKLDPHTPAYDIQQACGTGLQAVIQVANKIALGQIDVGHRRWRRHHLGRPARPQRADAPHADRGQLRPYARPAAQGRLEAAAAAAVQAGDPAQRRTAYRAVDGGARGADRAALGDRPGGPGRAGARLPPAISPPRTSGASSTTWSRRTWGCPGTRTCAATPPWRSSPSSSRSSAPRGRTPSGPP